MATLTLAQSHSLTVPSRRLGIAKVPLAVWNGLLLGIVVMLGVLYLVQVNRTMSQGYEMRDAEKRASELRTQARANQIKLSELEAVGNLTAQAQALGMVPSGRIEYVNTSQTGVALR